MFGLVIKNINFDAVNFLYMQNYSLWTMFYRQLYTILYYNLINFVHLFDSFLFSRNKPVYRQMYL